MPSKITFVMREILIWHNEPQLFLAEITDSVSGPMRHLCVALDEVNDTYIYLAVPCAPDDLQKLKSNKIDLRTFFNVPQARKVALKVVGSGLPDETEMLDPMPLTDADLPERGAFLGEM